MLLDEPGDRWPDAVAIIADAVDVILLHPPTRPTGEQLRRLTSRVRTSARQRGVALIVTGSWSGAHLTLHTRDPRWTGLGNGTGHLTGRRITVSSDGRAAHGRHREVDCGSRQPTAPWPTTTPRAKTSSAPSRNVRGCGSPDPKSGSSSSAGVAGLVGVQLTGTAPSRAVTACAGRRVRSASGVLGGPPG
jgi:hypothetical protein